MLAERKYALLQASAIIFAQRIDDQDPAMDISEQDLAENAVACARLLLAEIEKNEMGDILAQ